MNIKKYFLLASVGLMAVACQDKIGNEPKPSGKEGDEVVFGATLDESPESRTIYGDETSSGFPIKWLGDDQMIVASPQGCVGRNMADYGVDPTVLPNPTSQSAYAGTLVKKGDTGVQWGTSETADFYSIYPQLTDEVKFGEDSKTTTTNCTSFNIKVQEQQTCLVSTGTEPKMTTADMYACYMYAKTTGVKKGDPVNLKYVPFSTAIRFRLSAPTDGSAVTISNITLTSPNPIAGKYTVDLTSVTADIKYPAVTAGSDAVKSVSIFAEYEGGSGGYITLSNDQSVELNAFIMLDSSKDAGGDDKYTYDISKGWSLSVVVNGKKQTLSLDGTVPEGGSGILTAGKVHRLPKLPPLKSEEWKAANWLVNVPRNVYLSEVSIPGSWNS
ncbi:MAG: hypothetical protein HUJ98_13850, partial [Bacteroidaceae bacterium]|nr:hypothetical protein [Bacteroidaceae bacterium]